LPMDVEAMAGLYLTLVNQGLLKPEDAIARMQGLGLVPDGDPLEYLEAIKAAEDSETAGAILADLEARTAAVVEEPEVIEVPE